MEINVFDLAGLMPPLPPGVSENIFSQLGGSSAGAHTFIPNLISAQEFYDKIFPQLQKNLPPDLLKFISQRVNQTFKIREKLTRIENQINAIVGRGNFSALWLDRESFSADSMEHRALITESVIHVYSSDALQKLVKLLYANDIPMIPYGEGGGYNMGVTPMAPAVTVSVRGIDHISEIKPSRRQNGKFEISVGAGVPFKDLVAYLGKRGYALRCDPNTPRAATGGIAATGSNGGRKAFEVILHGRVVTGNGVAACFYADTAETECINKEPFLLARKFFSIDDTWAFANKYNDIVKKDLPATTQPNSQGIVVPLMGMKANANMQAQKSIHPAPTEEKMGSAPTLPISAFVGAEGTTGFIYEVTFEIEKPLPYLKGARWHFSNVEAAMVATRAIKSLPVHEQPTYFEILTGFSIRRYLMGDFPGIFSHTDEAVLILAVEGHSTTDSEIFYRRVEEMAKKALSERPDLEETFTSAATTQIMRQSEGIEEFEEMRKPREMLPKKLRTKCKTDMEIRTEYLSDVLKIVANTQPKSTKYEKQDVLFGHLTPNHTAIIHWNIGGFDLYDEEQADVAWDYLENVIGKAQNLAPAGDLQGSARFTGEHGVAGKAPFLWLNYIPPADFERMCRIKDTLDPKNLFNPETLFLRTSYSRSLRARLMNVSAKHLLETTSKLPQLLKNKKISTEDVTTLVAGEFAIAEGLRCTRCNSCKICPVIDAEHELEREKKRGSSKSVLPSKRNILMFMERMAIVRKSALATGNQQTFDNIQDLTAKMFKESATLLKKCFYCRKCDKACPVDIQIHPLVRAYQKMGKIPTMSSHMWKFIYERLMGEDAFKAWTYRFVAFFMMLGKPVLKLIRSATFLPDWLKSYTVPPTLSLKHYEPLQEGTKIRDSDNFVLISNTTRGVLGKDELPDVYIRYRGCMDTFGNPAATTSVDSYFKDILGARIVDLEKKMCCGFPFEADGLHERAKVSQRLSLIEIAKCIKRVREEISLTGTTEQLKLVVFSNCPTCCEAIREMNELLKDPLEWHQIKVRAQLNGNAVAEDYQFAVQDTAEIAMHLMEKFNTRIQLSHSEKTVGLKIPCHNTKEATEAQISLLKLYYTGVAGYDNCCGLSGTGRLKHPKIGTKISEKLFEQIRETPPEAVVSGCPSCRDGVKMQREILAAKKDKIAEFEVSGIFQQILSDCKTILP